MDMEYEVVVNDEMGDDIFLGRNDLARMGVIPDDFPSVGVGVTEEVTIGATALSHKMAHVKEKFDKLKDRYQDIFGNIISEKAVTMGGPMKIHLNDSDEAPFRAKSARRAPRALQDKADKLLRQLERSGVISRVFWPTPWASLAMFCPKPNSDKVRMVTDFTKLNKRVKRYVHGSPTAKQIRERFKPSSRFFAALDLNHGYFQIELADDSKDLTTFIVSENDAAVRYRYKQGAAGAR